MGKEISAEGGRDGKEREGDMYFPKRKLNLYMKITVAFGLGCSAVKNQQVRHSVFANYSRLGNSHPLCPSTSFFQRK